MIRFCLSQEINRLVLFRGVYLATRKRRIGFVTLLANWCFVLGSLSPCECLSSSTRPLIMGCSALLSVVSQLLSVCNPADFLVRLQRGATPVAAYLQVPAELCKAVAAAPHTFGNRSLVFPSRQNHYRPVKAFTRPASCSHPGISACRANDTPKE